MYLDSRLWAFTKGVRLRIAWAVLVGLLAVAAGIARLGLLGWILGKVIGRRRIAGRALPIVLVALGAGSVVASMVSTAPWLVGFSRNKAWVFLVAGALLATDYWILYRSTSGACQPGGVCHVSHPFGRWMRRVFWGSCVLFAAALGAAYLLLPVSKFFGY